MQDLSNNIYRYYMDEFLALTFDKQFHFASRLYLWSQDSELESILQSLQLEFTQNNNPKLAIQSVVEQAKASASHGSKNASTLRQPYFQKYPMLKTYLSVLFRITFLKTIYKIDASDYFLELFDEKEVSSLAQALLNDQKALATLSTHAINFLYLYSKVIKKDDSLIEPSIFLNVGKTGYDLSDKINIQLLIYLYTHCIIGESLFYSRAISNNIDAYKQMMMELETLIGANFTDINLDNKFEFLVCAKLLRQSSTLQARIFEEASRSKSSDGNFLIDKHNSNPQAHNISLDKSEHRNVLFIMANREFKPLES